MLRELNTSIIFKTELMSGLITKMAWRSIIDEIWGSKAGIGWGPNGDMPMLGLLG
jgi:hypothetical protein